MSVEQVESAILALPPEERQRLARWFDENRDQLEGAFAISDEARAEIERRSAELDENPSVAASIDSDYFTRMKRKVADVLAGKASSG